MRLTDNQALAAALAPGGPVVPVFVLDPKLLASRYVGEKRLAFLFGGLEALAADNRARRALNSAARQSCPGAGQPVRRCNAEAVYAERDVSPYAVARDASVAAVLPVPLLLTGGVTIRPLEKVLKDDGAPYTVFTPYSRRWRTYAPIVHSDLAPAPREFYAAPTLASEPLRSILRCPGQRPSRRVKPEQRRAWPPSSKARERQSTPTWSSVTAQS